jgi:hypothetical protein
MSMSAYPERSYNDFTNQTDFLLGEREKEEEKWITECRANGAT